MLDFLIDDMEIMRQNLNLELHKTGKLKIVEKPDVMTLAPTQSSHIEVSNFSQINYVDVLITLNCIIYNRFVGDPDYVHSAEDMDIAYFLPVTPESVARVIAMEWPDCILPHFVGQWRSTGCNSWRARGNTALAASACPPSCWTRKWRATA